ncbi:hypothetical protein HHL11_01560 [Ramlibacter sp. G-1-2-2]|uniref:Uncharacterized protein n=1 Tax=Ramlibacter agri TaxID=2728837 RepID=A0A848GUX1_9BURK|nr:hypothetical protein [Ramlibacter agri]NML42416.1 hypothetical protein [Ramlibacter agri]
MSLLAPATWVGPLFRLIPPPLLRRLDAWSHRRAVQRQLQRQEAWLRRRSSGQAS